MHFCIYERIWSLWKKWLLTNLNYMRSANTSLCVLLKASCHLCTSLVWRSLWRLNILEAFFFLKSLSYCVRSWGQVRQFDQIMFYVYANMWMYGVSAYVCVLACMHACAYKPYLCMWSLLDNLRCHPQESCLLSLTPSPNSEILYVIAGN